MYFYSAKKCGIIPTYRNERTAMKTSLFLIAGLLATTVYNANASHFYANSVSMNNIATIQDSIMHTAMHTFDRVPAANLGGKKKTMMPPVPEKSINELYGKKPMYGTMSIYGEYEEYEFTGRSGGDNKNPLLKNLQFTWQHYNDTVNLDNFDRTDSRYDLAMIGITGGQTAFFDGISGWAIYGGYIDGKQSTNTLRIDERGGYAGLYSRFNLKHFNLSATINGGVLSNDANFALGKETYTNMWAGAAANASINIILDNTFSLQPGVQIGYTWIKSDSYMSTTGDNVSNSDLGVLEITPALHAIKHIGSGWFGTAHVRYVMMHNNGGDLAVNNLGFETLESEDFTEYGLSLEKTLGRFNMSGTIVRRDGGRDGWGGSLNIKYIF